MNTKKKKNKKRIKRRNWKKEKEQKNETKKLQLNCAKVFTAVSLQSVTLCIFQWVSMRTMSSSKFDRNVVMCHSVSFFLNLKFIDATLFVAVAQTKVNKRQKCFMLRCIEFSWKRCVRYIVHLFLLANLLLPIASDSHRV